MKIARVKYRDRFSAAVVSGETVFPIESWQSGDPMAIPFSLPGKEVLEDVSTEKLDLGKVELLPPLSSGAKVICLGLNYRDHVSEAGTGEISPNPSLFTKFPDALVGHGESLVLPRVTESFDYEGEIAVVIGRPGRHICKAEAMDYVYGFTALMDGSLRDYQQHSASAGKCFFRSGSIGPWIVTTDSVGDYRNMTLETRLNGVQVQSTSVEHMIYDIPTAIEYISRWTPLSPGDIISTGTPAGVGFARTPPLWLKENDVIEVTVSGVGTLCNRVCRET